MAIFEIVTFLGIFLFLAMSYFYSGQVSTNNHTDESFMDKEYFQNMDKHIESQYERSGILRET